MMWFWVGFFVLVAILLALDLGVLNKGSHEPTFGRALTQTLVWVVIGLAFSGVVYLMYENHWLGARMLDDKGRVASGGDAAIVYVSAYLLEQALSIDNIFVIALLFSNFRVPAHYQHRVLFWGIIGAVFFRVAMLGGGAYLATKFTWIFYVFGAYLAYQGIKLLRSNHEEETNLDNHPVIRFLRRFVTIVDGEHGGKFSVIHNGRRALTTLAVCLIVVELTDIVFALDSIPAVLSVSRETFIMVTSNIFAILGLRSLYFVLAGAMAKFEYLKIALAILLILIGAKMGASNHYHVSNVLSLILIAGIIGAGVLASVIASTRRDTNPAA
ncbi:MAG: TerC/Alx family metal homeostasis membrane protein [Kofleriaceae bacterium]|nr:TerC/Alx family metal homeostasis membrane protein [Kofleriaceae bacterium]